MGKIEDFRIVLTKSTFISGESLTGTVCFQVTEKTKVDTLVLSLEGKGRIKW
jgi:hypothetical protein